CVYVRVLHSYPTRRSSDLRPGPSLPRRRPTNRPLRRRPPPGKVQKRATSTPSRTPTATLSFVASFSDQSLGADWSVTPGVVSGLGVGGALGRVVPSGRMYWGWVAVPWSFDLCWWCPESSFLAQV